MIGADIIAVPGPVRGRNVADNALQTASVSGDRQSVDNWVEIQAPTAILAQMQPSSAAA